MFDFGIYEYWMMYKNEHVTAGLIFMSNFVATVTEMYMCLGIGSFAGKVSDKEYAGTWMTISNAFSNFGYVWTSTLAVYLLNYLPLEIMFPLGVIYSFIFYFKTKDTMEGLDKVSPEKFKISNVVKDKTL